MEENEKERVQGWKSKNEERIIQNAKSRVYQWAIFILVFLLLGLVIYTFFMGADHVGENGIPAIMINLLFLIVMWAVQRRYAKRILKRNKKQYQRS